MSYSNGILSSPSAKGQPGPPGKPGVPGVGYKLTADGNFDIDTKRLTNLAESVDDNDAVSLKVLKEHTQVSQNNYHLQPSFKIYKEFGDKSQLTVGSPPNTPSNHFFNNHKAHYDRYIVDKEAYDTGFSGEAWSSMKLKGNQLESGSYTVIFEIFVISPNNLFLSDDTIIYHVYGDSHYSITTFNSNKINGQYTRSMIQFTTDGGAGVDDGIKFQIQYFGSQYNNNIKFLFYSRVIKGSQSTSFDHAIFNVSDVQDNHTILYFNNLNLNGNLINGLSDPVDNNDATNKIYVDIKNAQQDIAIADKASKSYVDNQIANVQIDTTPLLPRDGSRSMTGNLNMGLKHILNIENLTDHNVDTDYLNVVKDLKSVVNKEYLNRNFLKIKENYYDLNQRVIKNSAPHDDGSYDNNTLVSKAFVDAEISKLPKPDTDVLKLDGSKAMQGNLYMNNNNIKNLKDPVDNQDAGTKKYIDAEIVKIPVVDTSGLLPLDGSKAMTGNLNMGMKNILNIDTLNDYTDNSEKDRDLKSVVNKEYLNTHFLKIMGKGDYDFNLGGQIIKNCKSYYDGLFDDNSLVSKAFVDAEIAKLPKPDTDVLKLDGSAPMEGDLNMNNKRIINVSNPTDESHSANKKYVDTQILESERRAIESIDQENVFKIVMDRDYFKEDDSDIHDNGVKNKDFHMIVKKTYEFKIDYDSDIGHYSTRLGIDLQYLDTGSYTMVFEMFVEDSIIIEQVDPTSEHLSEKKIGDTIITDEIQTRTIIQLTKNSIQADGIDDLDFDIRLRGKNDPQTTIWVVVYGVKGHFEDVSIHLWDRLYYYQNDVIEYEAPIDMNEKSIKGVSDLNLNGQLDMNNNNINNVNNLQTNKIITTDLDINGKIDMKSNKITGLPIGTRDNDAVNKEQVDAYILNVVKYRNYFHFTDHLKHRFANKVKFPNDIDKYPFKSVVGHEDRLRILLSGYYHIIYVDSCLNVNGFIIHDITNGTNKFMTGVPYTDKYTQMTFNAVVNINADNGFGHSDIELYVTNIVQTKDPKLDGKESSTFFIKLLTE